MRSIFRLLLIVSCLYVGDLHAQKIDSLSWTLLAQDVKFTNKFNEEMQLDFLYPSFGKKLKAYEGKEVTITGYMIPLNANANTYAVSRYPFEACYFCGKSGPESVVSIKFKNKAKRYKTDEWVTIKGKLHLNETDVTDFIYILKDAAEK